MYPETLESFFVNVLHVSPTPTIHSWFTSCIVLRNVGVDASDINLYVFTDTFSQCVLNSYKQFYEQELEEEERIHVSNSYDNNDKVVEKVLTLLTESVPITVCNSALYWLPIANKWRCASRVQDNSGSTCSNTIYYCSSHFMGVNGCRLKQYGEYVNPSAYHQTCHEDNLSNSALADNKSNLYILPFAAEPHFAVKAILAKCNIRSLEGEVERNVQCGNTLAFTAASATLHMQISYLAPFVLSFLYANDKHVFNSRKEQMFNRLAHFRVILSDHVILTETLLGREEELWQQRYELRDREQEEANLPNFQYERIDACQTKCKHHYRSKSDYVMRQDVQFCYVKEHDTLYGNGKQWGVSVLAEQLAGFFIPLTLETEIQSKVKDVIARLLTVVTSITQSDSHFYDYSNNNNSDDSFQFHLEQSGNVSRTFSNAHLNTKSKEKDVCVALHKVANEMGIDMSKPEIMKIADEVTQKFNSPSLFKAQNHFPPGTDGCGNPSVRQQPNKHTKALQHLSPTVYSSSNNYSDSNNSNDKNGSNSTMQASTVHSNALFKRKRDNEEFGEEESNTSEHINSNTTTNAPPSTTLNARSIIDRLACKANINLTETANQNVHYTNNESNEHAKDEDERDVIYFTPQCSSYAFQSKEEQCRPFSGYSGDNNYRNGQMTTVYAQHHEHYARVAEQFVYEQLVSEYANDSQVEVQWVNKDGEQGTPYDIIVLHNNNSVKQNGHYSDDHHKKVLFYVEVKSTSSHKRRDFELSLRELLFAAQHGDKFKVYRVLNANTNYYTTNVDSNNSSKLIRKVNDDALRNKMKLRVYSDLVKLWYTGKLTLTGEVRVQPTN